MSDDAPRHIVPLHAPARRVLPQRRGNETFEFEFNRIGYKVTCGFYGPPGHRGTPGEIFIECTKSDGGLYALARDSAIVASIALQFGCPLDTLRKAVTRDGDGKPLALLGGVFDALHEMGIA